MMRLKIILGMCFSPVKKLKHIFSFLAMFAV